MGLSSGPGGRQGSRQVQNRFTHTAAAQLAPQVELIGGTQLGEQGPGLPLRRWLVAGVGHGASAAAQAIWAVGSAAQIAILGQLYVAMLIGLILGRFHQTVRR